MMARASVRFPHSLLMTSPTRQGWQMVAGGCFGAARETTTGHARQRCLHPRGMTEPRVRRQTQPLSEEDRRSAGNGSGTHLGCRALCFARWSAPFPLADSRLPAANPAVLVSESEIGTYPCRMDLKSLMQPCRAHEQSGAELNDAYGRKMLENRPLHPIAARDGCPPTSQAVQVFPNRSITVP
jgi:hypothetical protein